MASKLFPEEKKQRWHELALDVSNDDSWRVLYYEIADCIYNAPNYFGSERGRPFDTSAQQDYFLFAAERLRKKIGKFRAESQFTTFLTTVLRNLFYDWLRRRKGKRRLEARSVQDDGVQLAADEPTSEELLVGEAKRQDLRQAIDQLDPQPRLILLIPRSVDLVSDVDINFLAELHGIEHAQAKQRLLDASSNFESDYDLLDLLVPEGDNKRKRLNRLQKSRQRARAALRRILEAES